MDSLNEKKPKIINYLTALAISLTPILGPYKLIGPFSIGITFLAIVAVISIIQRRGMVINPPLLVLLVIHCFLSLLAYFTLDYNNGLMSMFWSIIMATITSLAFMQLLTFYEKNSFLKVISLLTLICGGLLIYQFIIINQNRIPFDGKLFESLVSGYSWSSAVTYRRMNSFFSEPSYFSIYVLPVMAIMLINKRYWFAILCCILLFVSTSSLGILGSIMVIFMYSIIIRKYKVIIFFMIGLTTIIIFMQFLNFDWLLKYNLEKIYKLDQNSQVRIFGYIQYFWELPVINQFLGVGFSQLSNYFSHYGLFNYSNAFILILINHGIIGLLAFVAFLILLFKKTSREGKIFLGILVMISSIDAFIYSSNFYYVLFFVLGFSSTEYNRTLKRFRT